MIAALKSSGISLAGIEPGRERHVTTIARSMVAGEYFGTEGRTAVISRRLAETLNVLLGDKVVMMASIDLLHAAAAESRSPTHTRIEQGAMP